MSAALATVEDENRGPAGGQTLLLLAVPLHARLLTDLAAGPRSLAELRGRPGSPPPTTVRGYLRSLAAAGVVEKRRHGGFPGAVDYRLTAAGGDLLGVAELHAEWLALAPGGGKALGTVAAKRTTRSLIEGFSSGLVTALADRPRSLTELDGVIAGLTYPALERRLTSMRRAGLVRPVPGLERRTPFGLSDWLRMASIPLGAASRWERRWLSPAPTPLK